MKNEISNEIYYFMFEKINSLPETQSPENSQLSMVEEVEQWGELETIEELSEEELLLIVGSFGLSVLAPTTWIRVNLDTSTDSSGGSLQLGTRVSMPNGLTFY